MNCKHFTIRTKNGYKYKFCRLYKKEIEFKNCKECNDKEYKEIKKLKGKKHKRTKATDIQTDVKEIVWNRDDHKCIFCHIKVPKFNANAHFIARSAGGLGIEENIFTACDHCHNEQDNGLNTKEYDKKAEEYLKSKYQNWNKEKLVYRKYKF